MIIIFNEVCRARIRVKEVRNPCSGISLRCDLKALANVLKQLRKAEVEIPSVPSTGKVAGCLLLLC